MRLDQVDKRWLLRNAIRMTSRNRKLNVPLCSIVGELCGVGSTSAHEICRDNGLNPSAPATDELPEAMMPNDKLSDGDETSKT